MYPQKWNIAIPKTAFSSYYEPVNVTVDADVPSYELPIHLGRIDTGKIAVEFGSYVFDNAQFRTNGFAIMQDYGNVSDITEPYEDLKERGIPIFVTADTMLHLYHIQFSAILKDIEEREFFDELVGLSNAVLEQSKTDYVTFDDPELKEAARTECRVFRGCIRTLANAD